MARYTVCSNWQTDFRDRDPFTVSGYDDDDREWTETYAIQIADLKDTRDGHVYRAGAYRIIRNGKAISGKGGTTPFLGETAWSEASRKFDDLVLEARRRAW